jgi:hypothetical protein
MWQHREKVTIYKAKGEDLQTNKTLYWHLDLELLQSRIVRKYTIVEAIQSEVFVMSALENQYKLHACIDKGMGEMHRTMEGLTLIRSRMPYNNPIYK